MRSAYGLIAGEVRIAWTDHLGAKRNKRVKFQFLKCFYLFGAEMAAEGGPSGKYDVSLETEGEDYVVPFAYKRTSARERMTDSHSRSPAKCPPTRISAYG